MTQVELLLINPIRTWYNSVSDHAEICLYFIFYNGGSIMWKYVKRYFFFAVLAGLFMIGEVMMDLLQPQIMGRIVDDGVLGLHNGGTGNLELIWKLGLQMIGLVLFGGFCGSLNNVVHSALRLSLYRGMLMLLPEKSKSAFSEAAGTAGFY